MSSPTTNHDSIDDCLSCFEGQFADPGAKFCSPCFPGRYYSADADVLRCRDCPAGWNQPEAQRETCNPCRSGTYQPNVKQPYCLLCEVGRYQSVSGKSSCDACPAGQIADAANSSSCRPCANPLEKVPNARQSSCEKPPWKVPSDCRTVEYLDDSAAEHDVAVRRARPELRASSSRPSRTSARDGYIIHQAPATKLLPVPVQNAGLQERLVYRRAWRHVVCGVHRRVHVQPRGGARRTAEYVALSLGIRPPPPGALSLIFIYRRRSQGAENVHRSTATS